MASSGTAYTHHPSDVVIRRVPWMHAAKHALMRSKMTPENDNPDAVAPLSTATPKNENILLNWILMIVGMGAIAFVGTYLPALFAMFK